ncbi:MAG: hypothetical protein GVY16_06265 [Planctomycetes bacterium]|jgi:hypothetical protein|nr:hypothetical protein [Phycisphaerae bacterium]NBB95328.1 hypothetical protein [Planctomycetota bacterium]
MTDEPDHDDGELIPLEPLDEAAEQQRARRLRELRDIEAPLRAGSAHLPTVPLEHREDLGPGDLEHFVVNYCLDSHNFHIERLELHVRQLRRFGETGRAAVRSFLEGRSSEPALRDVEPDALDGMLRELLERL